MSLPLFVVDAFASEPFQGNPAAVCLLPSVREEAWMQSVAAEMNLSETAFLCPEGDGFGLRWFTPKVEVALCGHATLAAAHTLWETGRLSPNQTARFHTKSGMLTAEKRSGLIEMDFPAKLAEPAEAPPGLAESLGVIPQWVGKSAFDYLVEVRTPDEVRAIRPDFAKLGLLPARGVIVTSRSDAPRFDFISRFFAPAVGVNEDPVTGSAHCCLGPYWQGKLGRSELTGFQASARGGTVRVRMRGSRVFLIGEAVTVLRAELL